MILAIAVARGTRDGSSMENAAEIWLIPNLLKLETYNQLNQISMADEFHGDLIVGAGPFLEKTEDGLTTGTDPLPPVTYGKFIQYGFCARRSVPIGVVANVNWDCINVNTGVDPAEFTATSTYASDFQVEDFQGTEADGDFRIDSDADATENMDPAKNWV